MEISSDFSILHSTPRIEIKCILHPKSIITIITFWGFSHSIKWQSVRKHTQEYQAISCTYIYIQLQVYRYNVYSCRWNIFFILIACSRSADCLIFLPFYTYIELIWLCNTSSSRCSHVNEHNCSRLKQSGLLYLNLIARAPFIEMTAAQSNTVVSMCLKISPWYQKIWLWFITKQ